MSLLPDFDWRTKYDADGRSLVEAFFVPALTSATRYDRITHDEAIAREAFALAAATEHGIPLSSVWNGDSPATVDGYTFSNYGDHSYGQVTLLQATENSINSAYVEVESEVGVDRVVDAAIRAGVPDDTPGMDPDNRNLTFVLGTASPSALIGYKIRPMVANTAPSGGIGRIAIAVFIRRLAEGLPLPALRLDRRGS